jgi:tetratricopeptide (TPR) repeat protein
MGNSLIRSSMWLLVGLALLLSACATVPLEKTPASNNPAVQSLVDRAQAATLAGRFGDAAAVIERALRIEPRNARVWYEYARVRMDQSQYRQAENLALRANSYAGENRRLRRAIWELIATTRESRGDQQGAAAARARAAAVH